MAAHRDPDFQRRSTETGKTFRDQCNTHLNTLGFTLLGQGPVKKVEIAKPRKPAPFSVPSDNAFQLAWHPDLKVRESGKRKRRKVSGKKERMHDEDQPRLFDAE